MSALNDYHDRAMEAAFFAHLARRRDHDEKRAMELFEQALDLELKAIAAFTERLEPSYRYITVAPAGWRWIATGRSRPSSWPRRRWTASRTRLSPRNCASCWRRPTLAYACGAKAKPPPIRRPLLLNCGLGSRFKNSSV